MENNTVNTTATSNNAPVATTEVGDTSRQQQPRRSRERFHTHLNNFSELDSSQFPQRPREERVPMWAQQLQKSIDLLSQEQEKMKQKIEAIPAPSAAYDDTKLMANIVELKKQIEAHDAKIRDNQKHAHDTMMSGLKDLMMPLNDFLAKQEPQKATRGFFWYILNPKTALKEWWQRKAAERRQRKAAKLEAKLKALQAQK